LAAFIGHASVESVAGDHCFLQGKGLRIDFYLDRRGDIVSSTLRWTECGDGVTEPLYPYVLERMFIDSDEPISDSVAGRVADEVARVSRVLSYGTENGISPRDWLYWELGYNCAYTSCINREFSFQKED
jgi:hypothetical protein